MPGKMQINAVCEGWCCDLAPVCKELDWEQLILNKPAKQLSDGNDVDLLLMEATFDVDPEVKDCFPISG